MASINNTNTILTSPGLEEDFSKYRVLEESSKLSEIASSMMAIMNPATKIVSALSLGAAGITASGMEAMQIGAAPAAAIGVVTGGIAYLLHKRASAIEPEFEEMMSNNIYKDIGGKHEYEYNKEDIDPSKIYTSALMAEFARRSKRSMWSEASHIPRRLYDHITYPVDLFFKAESEYIYDGFTKSDSGMRSLFLAHVMGELENSESPEALRIKQEKIFDRESVQKYMKDSGKMVKTMSSLLPSIEQLYGLLEKTLGQDARFIVNNLDNYKKGKESYFALELDILVDATRASQVEGVNREFAARLVNTMIKGSKGEITEENIAHEKSRFEEFRHLAGREDSDPRLNILATSGVRMADKILDNISSRGAERAAAQLNATLKSLGLIESPIHFYNMKQGSDSYKAATDLVMKCYMGKDVDLTKSFHTQVVESMMSVIEQRVVDRANSDFPTAKELDNLNLSVLDMEKIHNKDVNVFHRYLATFNHIEAKSYPDSFNADRRNFVPLLHNIRKYGMKSVDAISPDDASKVVLNRIKARMYYETFKPEMKIGAKSAGLDKSEFGLSM